MTKHYCDKCKTEIVYKGGNNPNQEGEINIGSGRHIFVVSAVIEYKGGQRGSEVNSERQDMHICLHCRLDALNTLDTRPTASSLAQTKLDRIRDHCQVQQSDKVDLRSILDILNETH